MRGDGRTYFAFFFPIYAFKPKQGFLLCLNLKFPHVLWSVYSSRSLSSHTSVLQGIQRPCRSPFLVQEASSYCDVTSPEIPSIVPPSKLSSIAKPFASVYFIISLPCGLRKYPAWYYTFYCSIIWEKWHVLHCHGQEKQILNLLSLVPDKIVFMYGNAHPSTLGQDFVVKLKAFIVSTFFRFSRCLDLMLRDEIQEKGFLLNFLSLRGW